jgi:hypothetical protein
MCLNGFEDLNFYETEAKLDAYEKDFSVIRRSRSVVRISVIADFQSRLNAASLDPLNPLAPLGWRLERIREILCLVHNLTVGIP